MTIATNERGDKILAFYPAAEVDADTLPAPQLAIMVGIYGGYYLLMYHRRRARWEIPGGYIEPGEPARAAALREFHEETMQTASDAQFIGTLKFRFAVTSFSERKPGPDDDHIRYGALFTGRIHEIAPFSPDQETGGIAFWNRAEAGNYLDAIDMALLDFCAIE